MSDEAAEVVEPNNLLAVKDGWKTTEFWLSLAMKCLGAWLISKDKDELGTMLILAAGGSYALSRTLVKKNRVPRLVGALLLTACLVFLPGCNSHQIDADEVGPLIEKVVARHDAYVTTDPSLTDAQRESQLLSSRLLIEVVREAQKPLPDPDVGQ
jgi:hypothetical protein